MPIPASPTTRIAPPRPVVAQRSTSARIRAMSASRPTIGPVTGIRKVPGPPNDGPASSEWMPTGSDWPRRTTDPRSVTRSRPRDASRVAVSRRISPRLAIDWMRAAVVIAEPGQREVVGARCRRGRS